MVENFVLETTSAPGTSATVNLAGAPTGRRTFVAAFATGVTVDYFMDDGTQAEWGKGLFTAGAPNTLARTTVIKNTAGTTARLNFTGTTRVYNEVPGECLMSSSTYPGFLYSLGSTIQITATSDFNLGSGTQIQHFTSGALRNVLQSDGTLAFYYGGATLVGSIVPGASSTAYNTTSDRRLKNLFGPHDGAEIGRIEVHDGEFIAEPGRRRPVFVADQLQAAGAGYAVHGEAGAVDAEGRIVPQMVDHSTLVPALIAWGQALERRIAALEANGRVGHTHVTDITPKT